LGRNEESILTKRKQELQSLQDTITEQLSRIEFIQSGTDDESYMNYHAVIKELPHCIVYTKKMTVPNYDSYFTLIPAIGEAVMAVNPEIKCITPEYCFIVYLDGEYKETNINIEYCEAVDRFGICPEGIEFKEIESTTAVSVMHRGAYNKLNLAYAYAFKWIESNGYLVTENPRESYIDGIWNKENEDDWLTELQVPVIKRTNEEEKKHV
jgi:effector-binding domain-containing protein